MLSLRKWHKLLQVKKFALLPAIAILRVLETAPCTIENLQISVSNNDHFDKSTSQAQSIKSTVKNMNSRPRKGKDPMDFYITQQLTACEIQLQVKQGKKYF